VYFKDKEYPPHTTLGSTLMACGTSLDLKPIQRTMTQLKIQETEDWT
jgi:hypothetical protein